MNRVWYKYFWCFLILFFYSCNALLAQQTNFVSKEKTFSMFREPSYISMAGGVGNIDSLGWHFGQTWVFRPLI